jgi:dephospho-CoA kinase
MITLIGIVGGIGSGKSAVTEQFRRLGAEVLDGDGLGHDVLNDPQVIQELHGRWGDRVLAGQAEPATAPIRIDRSEVAKIVFGADPQAEIELRYLEGVTHPRIRQRIKSRLEALERENTGDNRPLVVVLDAPLLLEAGWDELCHYLIYVDVPREVRLQRLATRGWDAAQLAAREARQLPLAEKRARADWIVDNGGTLTKMSSQIKPIWRSLTLPKLS